MKPTTPILVLTLLLPLAPAALSAEPAAQAPAAEENVYYRWIDDQGTVQYTDFEPVGVPSQRVDLDPVEDPDEINVLRAAESEWAPDAFHDQDDQILPIEHIGPCADARRQLAVLHAELPVYRDAEGAFRNAWRGDLYRGERRYLEPEERAAAITATRRQVLDACSDPRAFSREVETFRERIQSDEG
jgi:hypothetical protein